MSQPDPSAAWDVVVPDGWASAVIAWEWHDWREQNVKLGWRKWGDCPRCGHTMVVYQRALRSISPMMALNARCNCQYEHHGRPHTERGGCGPGSGPTKVAIPSAGNS
jgi:hypothetical protein